MPIQEGEHDDQASFVVQSEKWFYYINDFFLAF